VTGNAGDSHTDVVTAEGTDDEGNTDTDTDDATVNINNENPLITVDKTANPTSVTEPGGNVTFTVLVTNSSVEAVTLTALDDDIYGDLNGQGTCATGGTIAANGGTYSCTFIKSVTGNAGDSHTDVVTAEGTDDEGNTDTDTDSATVDIENAPPSATLTKSVTAVTYEVSVTNNSSAESITLNDLIDDTFGDVTQVQGDLLSTTCSTPQALAPNGQYTCSFRATVTVLDSPHTNTVTGTVADDDGGTAQLEDSVTVTIEEQ
jgi:hypothetical protein